MASSLSVLGRPCEPALPVCTGTGARPRDGGAHARGGGIWLGALRDLSSFWIIGNVSFPDNQSRPPVFSHVHWFFSFKSIPWSLQKKYRKAHWRKMRTLFSTPRGEPVVVS